MPAVAWQRPELPRTGRASQMSSPAASRSGSSLTVGRSAGQRADHAGSAMAPLDPDLRRAGPESWAASSRASPPAVPCARAPRRRARSTPPGGRRSATTQRGGARRRSRRGRARSRGTARSGRPSAASTGTRGLSSRTTTSTRAERIAACAVSSSPRSRAATRAPPRRREARSRDRRCMPARPLGTARGHRLPARSRPRRRRSLTPRLRPTATPPRCQARGARTARPRHRHTRPLLPGGRHRSPRRRCPGSRSVRAARSTPGESPARAWRD